MPQLERAAKCNGLTSLQRQADAALRALKPNGPATTAGHGQQPVFSLGDARPLAPPMPQQLAAGN
jgi:hypothetical protein